MRNKVFGILVCTLLIVIAALPATGTFNDAVQTNNGEPNTASTTDCWPMFRYDPQHSGYTSSAGPEVNITLWESQIEGLFCSPAVSMGKVYFGSVGFYCLNAETGHYVWNYSIEDEIDSSPAVVDGRVYFGSFGKGKVYCLNAETGDKIWDFWTGLWVFSSPCVADGKLYISSVIPFLGKVSCLNADTGEKIWERLIEEAFSSPAVANGKVYIGSGSGKLYCFNAQTGNKIWDYQTTSDMVFSSPAVANLKVYFGAYDGKVYCLNAETGDKIWEYQTTGNRVDSSPAVANGKVYISSYEGTVYCLNAETGDKIWEYQTGSSVFSSSAVADNKVYLGSDDGKVYCLNADTGDKIWEYQTGNRVDSSPAVANGKVYISSWGSVYCFGVNNTNNPPNIPTINGPTSGKPGQNYEYKFNTTDPNGDQIYFYIQWGDGKTSGWLGPYVSGETAEANHTWTKKGSYQIKIKAKDIFDLESDWSDPLHVSMSKNKLLPNTLLLWLLEIFPNAFPVLRYIFRL